MIALAEQQIIQIDITNVCGHGCSNCTRFCAHKQNQYFMDMDTFRKAVDSLTAFHGMVGIMGGEPTLHPQFREMMEYYREHIHQDLAPGHARRPGEAILHFGGYRSRFFGALYDRRAGSRYSVRRGLWTSLGKRFYDNYETIRDTFNYLCVNDHGNTGRHKPLLASYKDLGMSDEQFAVYRDDCWVQRLWSSVITPKGAFFCEVAGALDMLFNGPGGWPVEPGWWLRCPEHFKDQLHWCDMCGACLPLPDRKAVEGVDDISESILRKLEETDSPRIRKKKYNLITGKDIQSEMQEAVNTPYLQDEKSRVSAPVPDEFRTGPIHVYMVCAGLADTLKHTLPLWLEEFNREGDLINVITDRHDKETQDICGLCSNPNIVCRVYDLERTKEKPFNKPWLLNNAIEDAGHSGWNILTDIDITVPSGLRDFLSSLILNPGCLYYCARRNTDDFRADGEVPCSGKELENIWDKHINMMPHGYFQMFHSAAHSIESCMPRPLSEARGSAEGYDWEFAGRWHHTKRELLPFFCNHKEHGQLGRRWHGIERKQI